MQSVRLLGLFVGLQLGSMPSIARAAATTAMTSAIAARSRPRSMYAAGDSIPCAPASGNLDVGSGGTLSGSTDTRVGPRWSLFASRTLNVKIIDAPMIDGWTTANHDEVMAGLRAWESMNSPVAFRVVTDADSTDVTIHWVDHFGAEYDGWTTLTWEHSGRIVAGDVALAVHDRNGGLLSLVQRDQVMLHELGHVLGLNHSRINASIMRGEINAAAVSANDIQALADLYAGQTASAAASPDSTAAGKARRCILIR